MTTNKDRLKEFVTSGMSRVHILVVGDVMLDKYYYGEVTRISPEAPVPITRVIDTKDTMGGAANVAHNLALLGCKTSIAGFVGDDYHCQTLVDKFISRGIDYKGIIYREEPTTTKLRVIGGHQQMLRLDFEDTEPVKPLYANRLLNFVEQTLDDVDAIILSDYGKGACTDEVCESVIEMCNNANVPVLVDPKGRDWNKYTNADYITPNVKEINEILEKPIKNRDEAIQQAATYIMSKFKIKNVLATRSECGMSMVTPSEAVHIPTKSQEVFDVSGAGDTVIAVFALGIAGGLIPREAAYLANLAASVVVGKLGTYAVSKDELEAVLLQHSQSEEDD
ncbi:ADP-heptose synthase / D-glycero-beta-D-manno-heptose 7-phosphate kinase [Anaerovibrio sp. JC8]|uniref:D-glycero-beta-D-manno-heptose-7-phosphate kinase n=1 Tax=Anaerovibrio sp. JC8 TaxID=1240085 RepID=UPI000A0E7B8B|nr:D-glycero-beta-D-manno-heptose-7-phosphate kinase [Anaerovibrio sp. JC8]ORU01021.1 ADP-heptose synthase / D-glycero-beta-D-manno-heptose 7-phosphate kinase [Anaerovibrio sp. JC8]